MSEQSAYRGSVLLLLCLLTICVPRGALAASGWWNGDWQFRKAIDVTLPDTAANGMPASVVVPIRLHAGNFGYAQDLQPNGADLRFIAADGTPLKHQLELVDPLIGLVVAWVQVPVKTGVTQQSIWMYYGNPRATQPDNEALYDADQVVVLHFGESQGLPRDATANHTDVSASTAQLGVPGVIANGAKFNGAGTLRLAARPSLAMTASGGLTFAAWVHPDATSPRSVLYFQAQNGRSIEIGIAGDKLYAQIANGGHSNRVESTSSLTIGSWKQVAVSIGTGIALYVDGVAAGSAPAGELPEISGDVFIGGLEAERGNSGFNGLLDEVQISRSARSAWWVRTSALGQSVAETLVSYGADESKGAAGKLAAYVAMMRNLLGQVSLDGLVVIAFTSLLGAASFYVLISKAVFLRRLERADAQFIAAFPKRFSQDVDVTVAGTMPAADPQFAASGLYGLYDAGLRGLEATLDVKRSLPGAKTLGEEAFEAIRAALDEALVAATDRMNAGLVIMTVAIAGAPFLGLLGTVVGVMITFASIAAAGDVNVNTIAPGIAAAMTATVVGLLVAIPSLFGYNWLATRISRRTSALEVFGNRFVSGLALLALAEAGQHGGPVQDAGRRPAHAA